MAKHWCSKGKHDVDSSGFAKCQFGRVGMICKDCEAKQKKRDRQNKQREQKREDIYNNLFFNFKGL